MGLILVVEDLDVLIAGVEPLHFNYNFYIDMFNPSTDRSLAVSVSVSKKDLGKYIVKIRNSKFDIYTSNAPFHPL